MIALIMDVPVRLLRRGWLSGRWPSHAGQRRLQPALGIDEEGAGGDDPLAGREAARDRDPIAESLARLRPVAARGSRRRGRRTRCAGRPCRARLSAGTTSRFWRRDAELDVHEHLGLHPQAGICRLQPHLERPRRRHRPAAGRRSPSRPAACVPSFGNMRYAGLPTEIDVMSDSNTSAMIQTRLRSAIV